MKNKINVVFSSHLGQGADSKFKEHIKNTIGCKFETFCYVNNNQFSLTEIYNKALNEHHTDNTIFVFLHNDIYFKNKNWGKILLDRFNRTNYSIIGLAGTSVLDDTGIWWGDRSKLFGIVNHTDGLKEWESTFSPAFIGIKDVVTIDGVFIAVDPDNIEQGFDENYKGFHYYDISFCIPNYLAGCDIGITTDIRIVHKSIGITTPQWEANKQQFINQYADEFPISIDFEIKGLKQHNIKLKSEPKVTVIIPTKNNYEVLKQNIQSWTDLVKYSNYEILIADTGSDGETLDKYGSLYEINNKVGFIYYDYYNFAKINNDVVKNHCKDSDLILFCNDDIKLLNDCLSRIVEVYQKNSDDVGTIGIRLHYADNSVQHNGIYLMFDKDNKLHLSHVDLRKTDFYMCDGYSHTIGNTGGFLMINRNLFNKIGGFNEVYLECFEDVELNMECVNNGLKNITVFDAVAYHYESMTRKKSEDKTKREFIDYERIVEYLKK